MQYPKHIADTSLLTMQKIQIKTLMEEKNSKQIQTHSRSTCKKQERKIDAVEQMRQLEQLIDAVRLAGAFF